MGKVIGLTFGTLPEAAQEPAENLEEQEAVQGPAENQGGQESPEAAQESERKAREKPRSKS